VTTANETVDVAYDYIVDGVAQDASVIFGNAVLGAPINGGDYECTPADRSSVSTTASVACRCSSCRCGKGDALLRQLAKMAGNSSTIAITITA